MPIDYSKWDKIELSDDSDIEVHPNVDKRSFIRWKQQSIHEERAKRNNDIKNLEFQVNMNGRLNQRVDRMLANLKDADLVDREAVRKFLNANFDKTEKGEGDNVDPNMPPYNEMVEDLFEQLEINAKKVGANPKDGTVIRNLILEHRQKIDAVTKQAKEKLSQLYKEKASLISSDDIHTGFDKGFVNKKAEAENAAAKALTSTQSSAPSEPSLPAPPLNFVSFKDDVMELAPQTKAFGQISPDNIQESESFLLKNLQIMSEQQKDALMMSAFEFEMEGNSQQAYEVIHQSELISYIREIYDMKKIPYLHVGELTEVVKMFFLKVFYNRSNNQGKKSFLDSVQAKFEHVKKRVKVMQQEEPQEGVETIQLKSLDDSTELQVNLPNFDSKDPEEIKKQKAFKKLPLKMQNAIKTQSLDAINEVFAEMPVEEGEEILEIFNEGSIIGINALLEDEGEFQQLQEKYQSDSGVNKLEAEGQAESHDTEPTRSVNDPQIEISTADVVD